MTINCGTTSAPGEDACQDSLVDCGNDARDGCEINCIGKASCAEALITAVGALGDLTVNCGDSSNLRSEDTCKSAQIVCPSAGSCTLNCLTRKSCGDVQCDGCTCVGNTYACNQVIGASSAALANDANMMEFEHDEDLFGDYNEEKKITLSLSESSTIHLWAMAAVFLVANIGLYLCYNYKNGGNHG